MPSALTGTSQLGDVLSHPEVPGAPLIALLGDISSEPRNGGRLLHIALRDDLPAIMDNEGRHTFFEAMADVERGPVERWLRQVERGKAARYCHPELPLRWGSGGYLPIVLHRGLRYLVLSFRGIFPQGWNLAVGAAEGWEELLDVRRAMEREFREELLILNRRDRVAYRFDFPEQLFDGDGPSTEAWKRWRLASLPRELLRCRVGHGPDAVRVVAQSRVRRADERLTEGLHVIVDPEDLGIECLRIVEVPLEDDLSLEEDVVFLGGELAVSGLLDPVVGLLPEGEYVARGEPSGGSDLPFAYLYQKGRRLGDLQESEQVKGSWEHRNSLCPVTRRLITALRDQEKKQGRERG